MRSLLMTWIGVILAAMLFGICGCGKSEQQAASEPEVIRMKLPSNAAAPVKPLPPVAAPAPVATQKADVDGTKGGQNETAAPETGTPAPMLPDPNRISYHAEGKIDPFQPMIKDEPAPAAPAANAAKPRRKKREPQTPLERLDLSQLRLTAIVRTASGYRALVEESSGKGYMVGVGTYMGLNGGKVVAIYKDRFVIEEELEDALGNVKTESREIKLPKPSGDPS